MKFVITGSLGHISKPLTETLCPGPVEHPRSFSKLFKTKTSLSPLEFRQSFKLK